MIRVNIGCGQSPTPGWKNFDNSLTVRIAKSSLLTYLLTYLGILDENKRRFVKVIRNFNIEYADATKKIPLPDDSVEVLYSSHMLEHLDREEARLFLKEAWRVLKPGGIIRLVVPDLEKLVEEYLTSKDADKFIEKTLLGKRKPKSIKEKLYYLIVGDRGHFWMYDGKSLCKLLTEIGFKRVTILPPGKTMIPDPGPLNLREREDESVYVEGVKF
jgi:predicted SAM-dependent methyltransferase